MKRSLLVVALGAASLPLVAARPAAAQPAGDKTDAKALMASGLKLFQAKDYLGALAVFRDAYGRFPSSKILLNIATTLKQLNRNAEAANTYQRYLDAQDSDPAKKADVAKVIGDLDAKVGVVEMALTPADAEIQLAGEDDWHPAGEAAHYRVPPGPFTVRVRHDKFQPAEISGEVAAGKRTPLKVTLAPIPAATDSPMKVTTGPARVGGGEVDDNAALTANPSRFGALAVAHIDVAHSGAAARVVATIELIPRLQAEVGAILGPSSGGYAGARYAFLPGRFRPVLAAGMPLFIKDGAHVAIRGAAALEIIVTPHISVVVEAGIERVLNPGMNYVETLFIPAVGAAARL